MGNLPRKSDAIERSLFVKRPLELADDNSHIVSKKPKIIDEQLLQLIDINDHCLWHTFEFLNADDLVNMAEAHERFIPVAISVFRRLYRKHKKLVVPYQQKPVSLSVCPGDESIEPMLRHFGHLISHVLVKFLGDKHTDIGALLQQYSADSLVNLDLAFLNENDFQNNNKPFPQLERLRAYKSTLNVSQQQNIWFSNIQYLELVHVKLSQPEMLEINLLHLKKLRICNLNSELPIKTIREMLLKNPQLKSFSLYAEYDRALIEALSENVPALEVLELWAPPDRFSSFHDSKFHFASVKKFILNVFSGCGEFLVNVPFTFGASLEELTFDGFNHFKGQILDSVIQCTTVKSLKLVPHVDNWDDLMPDDLRNIFGALPQLTELEFCADAFVCHDVIDVLKEGKQLNSVNLIFMGEPWCGHFQEEIQKQWDMTKEVIQKRYSNGYSTCIQFCLKRKN